MAHDKETFAFYSENADEYAVRRERISVTLPKFSAQLPSGARVLELGCGSGMESEYLVEQGFDVVPTEGNPDLAKHAAGRLGSIVRVMRFDELDETSEFAGVWANMCLLHAPWEELDAIISKIFDAMKPGGLLMASFKDGAGAQRDDLGRYYNLPSNQSLTEKFAGAADWSSLEVKNTTGAIGFDDKPYDVLWCTARK